MEISVAYTFGGAEAIADSIHYPDLRLYTVYNTVANTTLNDTTSRYPDGAQWVVASPQYLNGSSPTVLPSPAAPYPNLFFSAVCYYYGRGIYQGLGGRVPIGLIESCWSGTRVEAWMSAEGLTVCGPYANVSSGTFPEDPSVLYNGMIAPLTPYPIRGVAWYQVNPSHPHALTQSTAALSPR